MQRKNVKKSYNNRKPIKKKITKSSVMASTLSVSGSKYCGNHKFENGHQVPIYEVTTVHALNQLIGYAKFMNRSFGDVYYRGECKLHNSLFPSLFRGKTSTSAACGLNQLITKISNDDKMKNQLKFDAKDSQSTKNTIEGMLQHYGIKTRFIDVVDNHWVALWMGLFKNQNYKQITHYNHYMQRNVPIIDFVNGKPCNEEDLFQYILLIGVPGNSERVNNGIFISDNFIEIDLRQALPSIFLRPHAQHGLVIKKKPHNGTVCDYDMSDTVIGILKIRIDRTIQWIGNGQLLSQDNLFPAPAYDHGYDMLLSRTDIFNGEYNIAKYI